MCPVQDRRSAASGDTSSAARREVTIEMPSVAIVCPHCGDEDTHSSAILEPAGGRLFAVGETSCDKCGNVFDVRVV